MEFYEVLDQVIDLLRSRGRVTCRALQRQFDLDDDLLEDLKDEIINAQRVAVEEDGRILVWTGEPEGAPVSTSQPSQASEQPPTQEAQPTLAEPQPPEPHTSEPHTPEAERRQLTVMFSDLVDSTKLSGQLDPEDYREVLRAYQSTCSEVIHRYQGYIAQHLGDALLVYFGFPAAHEDEGQRAILAGLGMLQAMKTLNTQLEQEKGIRLAIRVGIHTGLTVIGDVGEGQKHELLALGEAPNVASRIQGLAEPDSIAISQATYRLIEGYFTVEDLGLHTLKGVAEPQQAYRVLGESEARSRLDIASVRGLTPLVGRESEVTLLLERWDQVKDGQGQVVLLSGEGGIGKSRLVQVLKDHVAEEAHTRLECRSSPYYQNTALYPITDLLERTLQFQRDDSPEDKRAKLEQMLRQYKLPLEETIPLFATLLSLPISEDRYPPLQWSPQRQRQKILEALVAILLEQAEQQPVLFILEDLHWTDPTTLELLDLLIEQTPTASIYPLITCRPEFQSTWSSRSYLTQMTLSRLPHAQVEQIVERITDGKSLPIEVLLQIVEKTDGVPLYVEEMTKAVLESGVLKETDGQYALTAPLTSWSIPATLQDSLMARLDRLVTAKAVAQYASVIGRQFSYELLQAVSQLDEMTLQRELGRLVEAELIYQRGLPPHATYLFKHALVVDTAYESLLKSTRQQYHQRIGQVLEAQFPETVEMQPELLAHHYTEAGLNEQAVFYWQQAGEKAVQRSAYIEAIRHATTGLEVITILPDTPERLQHELRLQTVLGPALMHTKGFAAPEVECAYTRSRALCQQLEDIPQLFQILVGLWRFYVNRAEHHMAYELGKQLLSLSDRIDDRSASMAAHSTFGMTMLFMGDFVDARTHMEQAIALYNAQQYDSNALLAGYDSQVTCRTFGSVVLWLLGYPEQALCRSAESLHFAQELSHVPTLLHAIYVAGVFRQHCRDWDTAQEEQSKVGMSLASEYGLVLILARQTMICGWALAMQGHGEDGIAQIRHGLASQLRTGAELGHTYGLTLLTEAYGTTGQVEEGLVALAEALALVDKTGEHWFEAEIHRLKGQLLLQQSLDNSADAETCFHQAIGIAQSQSAKSWELRAATSLARLWQSQDKRKEAYNLLAPVYNWFTEGFDTLDLKDAKSLLDELS